MGKAWRWEPWILVPALVPCGVWPCKGWPQCPGPRVLGWTVRGGGGGNALRAPSSSVPLRVGEATHHAWPAASGGRARQGQPRNCIPSGSPSWLSEMSPHMAQKRLHLVYQVHLGYRVHLALAHHSHSTRLLQMPFPSGLLFCSLPKNTYGNFGQGQNPANCCLFFLRVGVSRSITKRTLPPSLSRNRF